MADKLRLPDTTAFRSRPWSDAELGSLAPDASTGHESTRSACDPALVMVGFCTLSDLFAALACAIVCRSVVDDLASAERSTGVATGDFGGALELCFWLTVLLLLAEAFGVVAGRRARISFLGPVASDFGAVGGSKSDISEDLLPGREGFAEATDGVVFAFKVFEE